MSLAKERFLFKVPKSSQSRNDDFKLWCLRLEAVLREKTIAAAQTDEVMDTEVAHEALVLIISALGDNQLQAFRSCTTSKEA